MQTANKASDSPSQTQLLALNHHVEWATLGFTRAIASSSAMCRALSTPAWLHLLLSIVSGQDSSIVITLPKQVYLYLRYVSFTVVLIFFGWIQQIYRYWGKLVFVFNIWACCFMLSGEFHQNKILIFFLLKSIQCCYNLLYKHCCYCS